MSGTVAGELTEWWVVPGTPVLMGYDICSNPILLPVDYYVIYWGVDRGSHWTCTCMAYAFSKSRPKTCKHIGRCTAGGANERQSS